MSRLDDGPGGIAEQASACFEPVWVSAAEVEALHARLLARLGDGPAGPVEVGMLRSAIGRARAVWDHERADLARLAAAHAFGIARNRPFAAGNERAAFLAMMLFLRKNGVRLASPGAEVAPFVRGLADGTVGEEDLARWLRDRRPIRPR